MSDHKENLKSMLQDLINDRPEQAEVTIHNYIVAKTQELAGMAPPAEEFEELEVEDEVNEDVSTD